MTLINRLTLFFLAALGAVLLTFSIALFLLAQTHLVRQVNDRATATLDTLVAAAEVEDDGLEWQPKDRQLLLRGDAQPAQWAVYDGDGRFVDGASDAMPSLAIHVTPGTNLEQSHVDATSDLLPWRIVTRTFRFSDPSLVPREMQPGEARYRALVFVTALPLAPVHDALRSLAWTLGGVSTVIWLLAAACGRWICRRALAPVRRMADAATHIRADDFGQRLPVPTPRDELHDLAITFNDLLTRLQDSFERQRRFTGEASHQLRTPLTALLGQLEVALRREREPQEYRNVLSIALAQTERLRSIVESLLFLARTDGEARLPELDVVDLNHWLPPRIEEAWAAHPRYSDLTVSVAVDGRMNARAQPALLGQAIDNLIDNAFKYSDPGSPVNVRVVERERDCEIVVEDRGMGLAPDEVDRVLEPFFRSSAARGRGAAGVGLGLAVSSRIATAFGGRLTIANRAGGGLEARAMLLKAVQ